MDLFVPCFYQRRESKEPLELSKQHMAPRVPSQAPEFRQQCWKDLAQDF